MSMIPLLASLAVALAATMATAWLVALRSGNHGWIDVIWSFAVGAGGVAAALVPAGPAAWMPRQIFVAALAAAWSLRLGGHILRRTLGGGDDPRYAQLRRDWGERAPARLFWFLQIQAAAAILLVLAIAAAARNPLPAIRAGDLVGAAILAAAVAGEAVADRQLARFRADPANRGRVCDTGLWGVSRHPNYVFEWLAWVAYPVVAIESAGGGYPFGFLALLGPLLMYGLLAHASGIPPTEAHMLRSRGDAYRAYQRRVNAFWPGPPRRPANGAGDP